MAIDDRGQLPAQIEGVGNAHVHSIAPSRDVLMCCVACNEDSEVRAAPSPCDSNVRSPDRADEDLVYFYLKSAIHPAQHTVNSIVSLDLLWLCIERQEKMSSPGVDLVLSYNGSSQPAVL